MQEGARGEINPNYVRHVHHGVEDGDRAASIFDDLLDKAGLTLEVSVILL